MRKKASPILVLCFILGTQAFAADKNTKKSQPKQTTAKAKPAETPKKVKPAPKPVVEKPAAIKKIEFSGIKRTPAEMLKAISDKYFKKGQYETWAEDMLAEIRAIPIVREAHLMRDMTGNVTVEIKEREPIAYLYLDRYYWMDEQGNVVQPIETKGLEDKIFFSGPWKKPAEYEKKEGPKLMADGIHFYSELLSAGFEEKKISEIHFDANLGWIMYRVGSRAPIVFGTQNLPQKIERFIQVVPQLTPLDTSISRVDADFNDRVVVKLTPPSKEVRSSH